MGSYREFYLFMGLKVILLLTRDLLQILPKFMLDISEIMSFNLSFEDLNRGEFQRKRLTTYPFYSKGFAGQVTDSD